MKGHCAIAAFVSFSEIHCDGGRTVVLPEGLIRMSYGHIEMLSVARNTSFYHLKLRLTLSLTPL